MSFSFKFQRRALSMAGMALCWLALLTLSSCGGGTAGTTTASLPGTGGTGITTIGPVNGFGSVIVNGTRFDDSAAQVRIDGLADTSNTLRLGMTTKIIGTQSTAPVSTTPTTSNIAVASSIETWSVAQGVVKGIQLSSTVTLAGLTLVADAGTVYSGIESLAKLRSDSVIKVWGLPSSADYSRWNITRLELLKAPQNTVTTGILNVRAGKLILNGMTLVNAPSGLADGQLIRVMGTITETTEINLNVIQVTLLAEAGSTEASTGYSEVQGIVSSILSTRPGLPDQVTRLTLGATVVDISSANLTPAGALIAPGVRLQVQGEWSDGVLIASQVKAISEQELKAVDVEGEIEAIARFDNIIVKGLRFDAVSLVPTAEALFGNLRVGTRVRIVGVKKDNFIVASSIEIK
jgi:hypothetical protein